MTVAGSDDLGDLLTASLRGCVYPVDLVGVRDHLLPAVTAWAERMARERAAEELRAAANDWDLRGLTLTATELRARADALVADDRTGQR